MQLSRINKKWVMKFILVLLVLSISSFAHDENLQTIQVSGKAPSNSLVEFVPGVTTLRANELKKRREMTLGDTLRSEAGVQSSSFGPNAGRPIIRGLEGDRIRVLQNGLGILDASSQSVDHAVPVDTLIIDSVEVIRGPMSLLYGSSAVGGVVNVNTNRIHSNFEKGALSEIQIQGDSSQDAMSTGAKVDYGFNQWMLHLDGGYRNSNDLRIPGKARSAKLRSEDPQPTEAKDKLPNSGSVQKSAAVGLSRIFNSGYVGASYYFFDNYYGAVAEENVKIKMKQNRVEVHGEYRPGGAVKAVKFKTAQSDYSHKELEFGDVGTTFSNEGNESRLDVVTEAAGVKGNTGVQTQMFNFSAVGDEAYLRPSRNKILALFTLQEIELGANTFSAGARMENFNIQNEDSGTEKNFNGYNGSFGYRRKFTETVSSNLNLSYTERAPNFQELYADGGHVATGTWEQGSDELNKEKAYAVDLGVAFRNTNSFASFNVYAQQFKDYIALFDTGAPSPEPEDFDTIFEYGQVDAIFYGFEFDSKHRLGETPWSAILRADLVRAKNKDTGDNLPRISPPRITVGIERSRDRWTWDAEAQYYFEQTKTAENEDRTEAFTLLNTGVVYDIQTEQQGKLSLFGRLKNILNEEARQHTSTLKDIAPMAGRNIVAGVQYLY